MSPSQPKSRLPLILTVMACGVLFSLIIFAVQLTLFMNTKDDLAARKTDKELAARQTSAPYKKDVEPMNIEAKSSRDLSKVCSGKTITNAPKPTGDSSVTVASSFRTDGGSYVMFSPGYGKANYLQSPADYHSVTVVACFDGVKDGIPLPCTYEGDEIMYFSATYTVSFYDVRTGRKLRVLPMNEQAANCPRFVDYDKSSKTGVATPSTKNAEATIDTYLRQAAS